MTEIPWQKRRISLAQLAFCEQINPQVHVKLFYHSSDKTFLTLPFNEVADLKLTASSGGTRKRCLVTGFTEIYSIFFLHLKRAEIL